MKNLIFSGTEPTHKRESKGGLMLEFVLGEPRCDSPKPTVLSPTKQPPTISDIAQKLKAAEERRLSLEAQKVSNAKKAEELIKKKTEAEEKFRHSVRESVEKK